MPNYGIQTEYDINSKYIKIMMDNKESLTPFILWKNIPSFYCLEKIEINHMAMNNLKKIINNNVKILEISHYKNNCKSLNFESFDGLNQMPDLKEIKIISYDNISLLNSLVSTLKKYEHKINKIEFTIPDLHKYEKNELFITYCNEKNITFILTKL